MPAAMNVNVGRDRCLQITVGAALIGSWAACGYPTWGSERRYPRRSHWHSPFDWDAYSVWDVLVVAVAAFLFLAGLLTLLATRDAASPRAADGNAEIDALARASLPRSIYQLLLGIAVADGDASAVEHAAVARVLRDGLPGVTAQDVKNWSTQVRPPRDVVQHARTIVRLMDAAQRQQVWRWCRAIAAADGVADGDESEALLRIKQMLAGDAAGGGEAT